MIGIITDNAERAIHTLRARNNIESICPTTKRGMFHSGRTFKIFDAPEQLVSVNLNDYQVIGEPDKAMIEMAKARMPR